VFSVAPVVTGGLDSIEVAVTPATDTDWWGVKVYADLTADGVAVGAPDLVYSGTDTLINLQSQGDGEHSVIVVPYDDFGAGTASSTLTATPAATTTDVAAAQATADGRASTFYAASAPTPNAVGDLWTDTSASPVMVSRWNGSTWDDTSTLGSNWSDVVDDDGSLPEDDADVTKNIVGTASIAIPYDSEGVIKNSAPYATKVYTLKTSTGTTISSGVTWAISVKSGSWSGTAATVTGSGNGTLEIESGPATDTIELEIKATYSSRDYLYTVEAYKDQDPPEVVTPTQASKGVSGAFTTTWTDVTDELVFNTTASATQATLTAANIDLWASSYGASGTGTANCELRWVWWNGSSWVVVGTADASSPDPDVLDEPPVYPNNNGTCTSNETKTSLSSDTEYKFKLQGRIESTTGSNTITAVTCSGTASGVGE